MSENKKEVDKIWSFLIADSFKILTFMFKQFPKAEFSKEEFVELIELSVKLNNMFRKNSIKKEIDK